MNKYDFIIVGQGIAGSLLAWYLIERGKKVLVIDENDQSSSSFVAAGIIHPVTGRRIVKTWMADVLLPFADHAYRQLEEETGESFFHPVEIMELLSTAKELNDWTARSGEKEFAGYIAFSSDVNNYSEYLQPFFSSIIVKRSCWVDTGRLLNAMRKHFSSLQFLMEEKFDADLLRISDHGVAYKNAESEKIIFCEGAAAAVNPLWSHLPFILSKGEVITIKAQMQLSHIINRKIFILPLGSNLFKVGSTYTWDSINSQPSEAGRTVLTGQLEAILKVPFEVVDHKAAIRPTVKDRRPFLGMHHRYKQVGIFNGLGTKGCLLAPYFANHFAGFLCRKNELIPEVDIRKLAVG